ncbi:C-terminal helicase domain-containing protein [Mycoplasmopsis felis]|nr:hypothetical protein [Mycoplasmopsis felis]WAM00772.1 C-terminal helicase domain-containing protein [Mycoplasmopsis felis]
MNKWNQLIDFLVEVAMKLFFGTVDSLLDYVSSLGVYEILLDKNYRSNSASLMTFSSKYFYNSQLDVVNLCNNKEKNQLKL